MSSARFYYDKNIQAQIAAWIKNHGEAYVAHAVWADNVDDVISSGYVESAECQLRKKHQVSFEKYGQYAKRGSLCITDTVRKIKNKEISYPPNPVTINSNYTTDLRHALKLLVHLGDEDFAKISKAKKDETFLLPLKNNKTCKAVRGAGTIWNTIITFEGVPLASCKDLEIRHAYSSYAMQVAIDCCSADPIDKRLAQVWEANKELRDNLKDLHTELLNFRYCEIDRSALCSSVRAVYNGINWQYGDVIVLSGNPEKIVSAFNFSNDNRKKDAKLENGQDVFLLEPFENGGEFFSLDLKQEDKIVLCPRAVITKHNKMSISDTRIFCFEDMSLEQLIFNVPIELRKIHSPLLMNSLLTSREQTATLDGIYSLESSSLNLK